MAKVEFIDGLKNVSGSITSRKIKLQDGSVVTQKLIATRLKSGKQRIYVRTYGQRLNLPSQNEINARSKFAEAAHYYASLTDQQKKELEKDFKRCKGKFNGKKYVALRGYIIARYYADNA